MTRKRQRRLRSAAAALIVVALAGCRARPAGPQEGGTLGDAGLGDGAGATGDGASGGDGAVCPVGPVEICGNGCDDDGNGYVDDDDPACTVQFLVTAQGGSAGLQRLILGPSPSERRLDGNAVPAGAFAVYEHAFAPAAFLGLEGATRTLRRIALAASGTGTVSDNAVNYAVRDVCVFHGELVVVDRLYSRLHRLMPDGKTEIGQVQLSTSLLYTACASDGTYLYVAEHDQLAQPSDFAVLDDSYTPVGAPRALPSGLAAQGFDRCLDFAWSKQKAGFYGLFVNSNGNLNDGSLSATQLFPFAMDGGAGPPVDAGTIHGLGAFLP
jgi:hypothetical protein